MTTVTNTVSIQALVPFLTLITQLSSVSAVTVAVRITRVGNLTPAMLAL